MKLSKTIKFNYKNDTDIKNLKQEYFENTILNLEYCAVDKHIKKIKQENERIHSCSRW